MAEQAGLPVRCPWPGNDPLYITYHDVEWGAPLKDDQALFELLLLEGFQAGLSWLTILKRREGMRQAFDGFDPARLAAHGEADRARLLSDPRIIRNRLKVAAAATNARAYLKIRDAGLRFSDYLWNFVDGRPIQNARTTMACVPAETPLSGRVSRDLKSRGFTFVGSTIVYAYLQSAGLVNDHLVSCFRWRELGGGA